MIFLRKAKKFLINGTILTITSLIMRGASVIFNVYISNKIGSESVGVFSLVMSVYLFFVTLSTSGLSIAVTCILSEEFEIGNKEKVVKTIRTSLLLSLILSIVSRNFVKNIFSLYCKCMFT